MIRRGLILTASSITIALDLGLFASLMEQSALREEFLAAEAPVQLLFLPANGRPYD